MDEHGSENSFRPKAISFRAEGVDEAQRLAALLALGMCRAITAGAVNPIYACRRLFRPALMKYLEQLDAHPALRHAIYMGTELEDVAELVPDDLSNTIMGIESELLKALTDLVPGDLDGEKWLTKSDLQP